MITEMHMDAVASFKQPAILVTDKRINLVYGLNGVGKSTVSNFLYAPEDVRFAKCKRVPTQTEPVLVYNQKFIQDNFFVADNLKGVFSLSRENKEAEEKIAKARKLYIELSQSLQQKQASKDQIVQAAATQKQQAVDEVWKIKAQYSGGDRVLEYCLEGLKGQKEKLFAHLQSIGKPSSEPERNIQVLRSEVDALKGDTAQPQQKLPILTFVANEVESDPIFATSILGNADSEVAALIDRLGNSDWVKQGLAFLPEDVNESGKACPFCQEDTITSKFVSGIREYFDDTYQQQIETLETLKSNYVSALGQLVDVKIYTEHQFALQRAMPLSTKHQDVVELLRSNLAKIEQKIKKPKSLLVLAASSDLIADFNKEIDAINTAVDAYNERLKNREIALSTLKDEFWSLMRWQYDQTMTRFEMDCDESSLKLKDVDIAIGKINIEIADTESQISLAQKETVNTDEAVVAINAGLLDIGIDGFSIAKHSESLYRVTRAGESEHAFHTLSEGEKMMISFLYFCELCKGKSSPEDTHANRIVVIDDPISSLSHVFIFNIGQLIRSVFFKNDRFCQVFVLTHSLYFFYELTDTNHERRKETQKLFRITKSAAGSSIQEMKYEEIQNDYQAYWSVINDPTQPPALIANCMRNVVEYFFNFVRKKDLNNVFLMPELQGVKFQSFCRYINRESHSLGQNIIDMKEFDYETFKEGLRMVFEKTGYGDHIKAMSKV
ncbi:AAA family ATPase [Dechloromonas sp. A34]|uniref:AAA family ATPase n=1 Tax=Dechloromonas sp. A34 TaxID=447588 RepID=UPI00224917AD|nr:AAA family ATPase [Dechloromonas sp. A34]